MTSDIAFLLHLFRKGYRIVGISRGADELPHWSMMNDRGEQQWVPVPDGWRA